jgi:pyrroline-5-carboxylate reductase
MSHPDDWKITLFSAASSSEKKWLLRLAERLTKGGTPSGERERTFGDVRSLEAFARYFIEQRNLSALQISTSLKKQNNYFNDFIETRATAPVALIGAGKMGTALLESWLGLGLRSDLIKVVEPHPTAHLEAATRKHNITLKNHIRDLGRVSVLFLAIKPQDAESVLPYFAHSIGNNTLIVSIMAGKSINLISQKVKRQAAIVRAMPNIAASIGKGVTAAIANDLVDQNHLNLAHGLLLATGAVEWIKDESLMDAVTAVSGSGPAYLFLLAEALELAGKKAGLPDDLAATLARRTIVGSSELLERSKESPEALRHKVTSPNGTTAAALRVLMAENGLLEMMSRAVAAAAERSRELAE